MKIIKAMNALIGDKSLLEQQGWIFEPKLDGFRAILYVNDELEFLSRNNLPLNDRFPDLPGFRKNIKAKSCILDGEIVAFDSKGTPRISLLGINQSHYIVFDILMKNGKSLIDLPLIERKKILEKTVKNGKIIENNFYTTNGKKLWKIMLQKKFEGVMAKKIDSKYYPGLRTKVWLKIKNLNTADCVIMGYKLSEKREFSSLILGLYDENGSLHYVGNVGTGFSYELIDQLLNLFKKFETDKKPTRDIIKQKDIVWLKPHFVCEIAFLEFTKDLRVRHSAFKRLRPDKKPRQCTLKANVPDYKNRGER